MTLVLQTNKMGRFRIQAIYEPGDGYTFYPELSLSSLLELRFIERADAERKLAAWVDEHAWFSSDPRHEVVI